MKIDNNRSLIIMMFNDLVKAGIVPRTVTRGFFITVDVVSEFHKMINEASEEQCTEAIKLIRQRL